MKSFVLVISFFAATTGYTQNKPDSIKIGNQTWAAKNLDVDKFQNGDPIPQAKTVKEWAAANAAKKPAWCYYKNDPKNAASYGKLYNYFAVSDPRGIAPKGWHVPTNNDWAVLNNSQGDFMKAGNKLKSTTSWIENGNGTNAANFNGTPGGVRSREGEFSGMGKFGHWWTSTTSIENVAYIYYLDYRDALFRNERFYMGDGLSVRLVSDYPKEEIKKEIPKPVYYEENKTNYEHVMKQVNAGPPCTGKPTVTDVDGNVYNTVQLGNQCWIKENLRVTHYADGTPLVEGKGFMDIDTADRTKYWFAYKDSIQFAQKYGLLYTWAGASNGMDPDMKKRIQGICPNGWHIPTLNEWYGANGDGTYGLPNVLGGSRYASRRFGGRAQDAAWWSNTPGWDNGLYYMNRRWNDNLYAPAARGARNNGFSVKCVCDE